MRTNQTYTYAEIEAALAKGVLRDSPSLEIRMNNLEQYIQTAHCTSEQLAAVPGWSDARWVYEGDTDEWIPCFHFASDNPLPIEQLVDAEPDIDPYAEKPGYLWVTPKGLPREQYYKVMHDADGEPFIQGYNDEDRYPMPVFDEHGNSEHHYRRVNNPGRCDLCKGEVEKRINYRDPEEGNSVLYEACVPCVSAARKAYLESCEDYDG